MDNAARLERDLDERCMVVLCDGESSADDAPVGLTDVVGDLGPERSPHARRVLAELTDRVAADIGGTGGPGEGRPDGLRMHQRKGIVHAVLAERFPHLAHHRHRLRIHNSLLATAGGS